MAHEIDWGGPSRNVQDPVMNSITVTPSDADDLLIPSRGLLIGVAGAIKVTLVGGTTDTYDTLAVGVWHPMAISRIWDTGTDADEIHVGW